MKKYIIIALLLMINVANADEKNNFLSSYSELLSQYVAINEKNGTISALVDYNGWKNNYLHSRAMEYLRIINPSMLKGKEKMAFWINVYNFLTIDLIIKNNEKKSIKNLGTLFKNPWKANEWKINDKIYTLDQIEHKILRPMGDARIHFAINCASLSCPDLRAEPYIADKLNSQLDEQVNSFLNNESKSMSINGTKLKISKIFDWFEDDFHGKNGVLNFIREYSPKIPKTAKIEGYLDYNWQLNSSNE